MEKVMIESDKVKTVTVNGEGGKEVTLYLPEMETDPVLKDAIAQYDEIVSEATNIEFQRNKINIALSAMRSRVYECALDFYKRTRTNTTEESENADNS
jgi:hypothetical protein